MVTEARSISNLAVLVVHEELRLLLLGALPAGVDGGVLSRKGSDLALAGFLDDPLAVRGTT